MARELELKFKLESSKEYIERLRQNGVSLSPPVQQCDTIFFRSGKCFQDLPGGEPVIRIRQANHTIKTTVKRYIMGIAAREEVECVITDVDSFKKYLSILDFFPIVIVKKERRKGSYRGTTITVDRVEGLGDYTEIEIVTQDESVCGLEIIKRVANELGLEERHLVSTPYDEMLFMKGENND